MGLFDRFFKRKRIVTAEELAKFLVHAGTQFAFQSDQSLHSSMKNVVDESEINVFELLLVAVLPLDMIVVSQFKGDAHAVRSALKVELVSVAREMIKPEYGSTIDWTTWPEKIEARFLEYGQLMHEGPGSDGVRRYSMRASEHILGYADPAAVGLIAAQFSLALNHMGDTLEQYSVVN